MAGKILVFLENYHGVYYPGQTISGRVECFFTNEESFKAVKIRYDGRAETKWTESETYYDDFYKEERSRDVEYGDKEVYFSAEYILVQGGDNYTHPAGNHTFPFSYVLPQDLPASYEGTYGSVRYNIKAIIDRSWRSDDESEIPLNVASPLDLNYLSELREPVAMSVDSTPCSCWCQNSGPITFNVSLPAIGFAPGQEINIGAYIENMSNVSAESVTFEFFADFEYLVRTPRSRRYEENYITGCTEGGVGAHGDKSWTSTLTIPSDSSFPNLIPCSIIKVKYLLKARVKLPCPHSDLYARVELMIGSVPLTGVNTSLPGPPPLQGDSYSYNPTAPPIYGAPNIPDYSGNANNSTDGIILRPYPPEGASYPSGEIPYLSEGGPYSSIRPPHPSGVPPYPSGATPYAPGVTGWTVPTESIKETDSSSALVATMSSVNIILDNYNNTCYPGQTIAGRVECNFSSEKNLRAVRIKFRGRAKTEWTETERYYDHAHKKHRSRSIRYYAEEPYFDAEYNLIQGGENFQLPAGRHVYPFSYILPTRLPSSFEGSYGSIRYYIKATVDRPWKFDYEDKFALNVDSPLDLNYIPGLREPIATSVDKTMCSCWCNDSGALTFNMSLPASGFVPGQEVNIGAYVQNMTNVTAENVRFKIVGNLEFITRYPSTKTRYDEILIAACSEGGIGAHGEKSWTSSLTIPAEYVPNLMPCNIINISYTLHGKVVVPCPHTNLENDVRVMIGTVPLTGVSTTFPGGPPPEIPFPLPSGPTTEGTPLLPPLPAPYPGGDVAYPPGGIAPYPPGGSASYPPGGVAPYPPGGNAPYPPSGGTPYPPSGDTKYPPPAAPYSPGGVSNGFGDTKNPSAPPAGAPYPAGGTPYPPAGAPSASAPAPSAPDVLGGAPYPPSSAPAADSSFSLPSYEEAENLKEKSEKPEKEKN